MSAGLRTAIRDRDFDEKIVGRAFRVFGEDVEVAALVEDAGVGEFELRGRACRGGDFPRRARVGKFALRVFVEAFEIGVGGRGGEVEMNFFDILAVIALWSGEAEEALFENRIFAIPESERETEAALAIADAEQAILAPPISAAAGVIMGKIVPAFAVAE